MSVFLTRDSAQAAAELHCWLGWGDYEREPDCLAFEWDDAWCREPVITRQPVPSPVDDKFVLPGWELQDRSEPWGYPFGVAQSERGWFDKQIPHLGAQRLCWQGFNGQPAWTRATQGWFNLATPYGELVVRRHGDCWVTERNGRPLCYGPGAGDEAERPDGKRPRGLADLQLVFGDTAMFRRSPCCGPSRSAGTTSCIGATARPPWRRPRGRKKCSSRKPN